MAHLKHGEHYVIIKGRIHKLKVPMELLRPLPRVRWGERVLHKRARFYGFKPTVEELPQDVWEQLGDWAKKILDKLKPWLEVWRHVASAAKYCGNKHRKIEVWTFTKDEIDLSAELEEIIHNFATDECSETFVKDNKLLVKADLRSVYNYSKEKISTVEASAYDYRKWIWPKWDYEEIEF